MDEKEFPQLDGFFQGPMGRLVRQLEAAENLSRGEHTDHPKTVAGCSRFARLRKRLRHTFAQHSARH